MSFSCSLERPDILNVFEFLPTCIGIWRFNSSLVSASLVTPTGVPGFAKQPKVSVLISYFLAMLSLSM